MQLDLSKTIPEQYSARYRKILDEIREPFVELCDRLAEPNAANIEWWVSNVASRNPYASSFFNDCGKLVLIKVLLENQLLNDCEAIIVPDQGMAGTVEAFLINRKIKIPISWTDKTQNTFRQKARRLRAYWSQVIKPTIKQRRFVKRLVGKREILPEQPISLIDTYVLDSSFPDDKFQDRQYGPLYNFLSKTELDNTRLLFNIAQTQDSYSLIEKALNNTKPRFIFKESYLKLRDFLWAMTYPIRIKKFQINEEYFYNFNIKAMVAYALERDKFLPVTINALLLYRFIRRLSILKVRLRFVVDWFENQWQDRALNAALQRFYPEIPRIGYQGYKAHQEYLCMYPSSGELRAGVLPAKIGVIGPAYEKTPREFCELLDVVTVPALRFDYLYKDPAHQAPDDCLRILVALPLLVENSRTILVTLARALQQYAGNKILELYLKPHPVSFLEVETICGSIFKEDEFKQKLVKGSMGVWLDRSHVMITGNFTSACMEGLARGVPVVLVASENEGAVNPIPDNIPPRMWRYCLNSDAICDALHFFVNDDTKKSLPPEWIDEIRRQYFHPVNRQTVAEFLQLD